MGWPNRSLLLCVGGRTSCDPVPWPSRASRSGRDRLPAWTDLPLREMLASMHPPASTSALRAANCWFAGDKVTGDPASTAWKRLARWRQAQWREARHHPVGAQPYAGGARATRVGSRLQLAFARLSGANFITDDALAEARRRIANPELHQMLLESRLWADLLSSMPLCFNLFGTLGADPIRAADAVRAWWPDAPQGDTRVRFEHSPGRSDPAFLGNRSAFDVAFEVRSGPSARAIVGVETKYQEHAGPSRAPSAEALARYVEVSERSGAFGEGWRQRVIGTPLQQIWQDHTLLLSMLQHPSKQWTWGRFVLVYPSENPSFARAAAEYRETLRDGATFESRTIEDLLATRGALDPAHGRGISGTLPLTGSCSARLRTGPT